MGDHYVCGTNFGMKQEKATFTFARVDAMNANASSAKLTIEDDLQG